MHRIKSKLPALVCVVSFLVGITTAFFWVRSYYAHDIVVYTTNTDNIFRFQSHYGAFHFQFGYNPSHIGRDHIRFYSWPSTGWQGQYGVPDRRWQGIQSFTIPIREVDGQPTRVVVISYWLIILLAGIMPGRWIIKHYQRIHQPVSPLLLLGCLCVLAGCAHTRTLEVHLIDAKSARPLAGVQTRIDSHIDYIFWLPKSIHRTGTAPPTDASGVVKIEYDRDMNNAFFFSLEGYETALVEVGYRKDFARVTVVERKEWVDFTVPADHPVTVPMQRLTPPCQNGDAPGGIKPGQSQ